MEANKTPDIDTYIAGFTPDIQQLLEQVRKTIQQAAPEATEAIRYGIPTFRFKGKNLVHFAAHKQHIGFYATPSGHEAFQQELSVYKQGKGSVQFPFDQPLPLELMARITRFRVTKMAGQRLKKK